MSGFSKELTRVFDDMVVDGKAMTISPPSRQLSAKLYAEFKQWMTRNLGRWVGGNRQLFQFEFDPTVIAEKLRSGERPNFKKDLHWYATTPEIIDQMCNIHVPADAETIIEPSAGRGEMVEGVNDFIAQGHKWSLVELDPVNRQHLVSKGMGDLLVWADFDTYTPPAAGFSLSMANPPFRLIADHVPKIVKCLADFGCMVCVAPSSFPDKHSEIIERMRSGFERVSIHETEGKFKDTAVSTVIIDAAYKTRGIGVGAW